MKYILQIPAVALKNACAGLSKVIRSKPSSPVLGFVRIEADSNGVARLQAADLDSFVTCELQSSPGGFPACLVSFDRLSHIAKSTSNPVRLTNEGGRITVESSIGTAKIAQALATHPLSEWPVQPQLPNPTYTGNAVFKKALHEALQCASTDSSRHVLNGVCLDRSRKDCHCVVASDGRHLFSANTFRFSLPKSIIIPTRKFIGWSGFHADGDLKVGLSQNKRSQPDWVQLKSDHWTFVAKSIDGNYPNWRHVIPSEDQEVTAVRFNEDAVALILEALRRLPSAEDLNRPVDIIVAEGDVSVVVVGKSELQSNTLPVSGATISGKDVRIRLNRDFLFKALRFGFTRFTITDELSPILFTAPGRQLVVMPIHANSSIKPVPRRGAEAVAPASPSAKAPEETQTDKRNTMPTENNLTAPRSGNLQPSTESSNGTHNGHNGSALSAAVTQIETVRAGLRDLVAQLGTSLDLLRAAEREKRASAREVDSVRATLRSLQKVAI